MAVPSPVPLFFAAFLGLGFFFLLFPVLSLSYLSFLIPIQSSIGPPLLVTIYKLSESPPPRRPVESRLTYLVYLEYLLTLPPLIT